MAGGDTTTWLVTGGSGFLGINLIRYLLEKGHRLRSLDLAPFTYAERDVVEARAGDIRDEAAVDACMKGVDVVVHCAAALPLYSRDDIFSTDVEGTRNVLKSALEHGVGRLIHISTTAAYGIPDHHPVREDDPVQGTGPYGEAKILSEREAEKYRRKGMCVPIIRPGPFVGPERLGAFAILYEWAKDGKNFPVLGDGKNRLQLLDVEDLCEAIYLCATRERELVNDTFNLGAREFTTMKEDFQAVLDLAGYGKRIICFPAWPMIAVLRVLEALRLSPLYKWMYQSAWRDNFVSIEKIERKLGFVPKHSNKAALIRNYEWYIRNFDSFSSKSGVSHSVPWKQGILKLFKLFF